MKVSLHNASHLINCLKLYVSLRMHKELCVPPPYKQKPPENLSCFKINPSE